MQHINNSLTCMDHRNYSLYVYEIHQQFPLLVCNKSTTTIVCIESIIPIVCNTRTIPINCMHHSMGTYEFYVFVPNITLYLRHSLTSDPLCEEEECTLHNESLDKFITCLVYHKYLDINATIFKLVCIVL